MEHHARQNVREPEYVRDALPYIPPRPLTEDGSTPRRRRAGRPHVDPGDDMDGESMPPVSEEETPSPGRAKSRPADRIEVLATNRTVCLSATLASLSCLFAVFLLWSEKDSCAIRRFSIQSVALRVVNLLSGVTLWLIGFIFGFIPILGFLVALLCWIVYFAMVVWLLIQRAKLMQMAWRGLRYELPIIQPRLRRWLQ